MMDPKKESLRKIPTVHAPTTGGDIGSPLKAARQKKGWSLDNVAQQTRIPKKYLDAMENNRTDELPALVYLRGFLKGYCDYLEVEFEPLWKQITEPQAPAVEAAPAAEAQPGLTAQKDEPKPTPAAPVAASEVKEPPKPAKVYAKPVVRPAPKAPAKPTDDEPSIKYAPAAPKSLSKAPVKAPAKAEAKHNDHHGHEAGHGAPPHRDLSGTIALAISIAVALGVFIWLKKQDSKPAETPVQVPVALAPVASQGADLSITFKEEVWISLKADGSVVYEGLVPKDASQKWKAQRGFLLRTPHAQDLSLTLNGQPYTLKELGPEGDFKIE